LGILNGLTDAKSAKYLKLLYYYQVNSNDEGNSQIKLLINEIKSGMTDPVRTAAIIELQNHIKNTIGKQKIVNKKLDEGNSSRFFVKEGNKQQSSTANGFSAALAG
jgi:hypothetical protein